VNIDGIDHIALNVRDLARAERFYTEILGFKVASRIMTGAPHIMVNTGNSMIALFEAPDLEVGPSIDLLSEEGYLHFAFRSSRENLVATLEELQKNDIQIEGPVQRGSGTSVYFNDPDDNHLEIHFV